MGDDVDGSTCCYDADVRDGAPYGRVDLALRGDGGLMQVDGVKLFGMEADKQGLYPSDHRGLYVELSALTP